MPLLPKPSARIRRSTWSGTPACNSKLKFQGGMLDLLCPLIISLVSRSWGGEGGGGGGGGGGGLCTRIFNHKLSIIFLQKSGQEAALAIFLFCVHESGSYGRVPRWKVCGVYRV